MGSLFTLFNSIDDLLGNNLVWVMCDLELDIVTISAGWLYTMEHKLEFWSGSPIV